MDKPANRYGLSIFVILKGRGKALLFRWLKVGTFMVFSVKTLTLMVKQGILL